MEIILHEEQSIILALGDRNGIEAIKNELKKSIEFSKNLEIVDFDDKKQVELVKSTKNGYVKTRNTIDRAFKSKRDEYNFISKQNLEVSREVIAVIEGEEKRLDEMIEKAELLSLKKQNEGKLQYRKDQLKKYDFDASDEDLLLMKDKEFDVLLLEQKQIFLDKKEQEMIAEQARIAREKELEEAKKQARIEAEEKAKKDKEEMERKQKEELARAEQEKQKALEDMARQQKEKEEREEQARIEAKREEEANQKKLEKEKVYIAYRDSLEFDKFEKEDGKIVFYKKVGEFVI